MNSASYICLWGADPTILELNLRGLNGIEKFVSGGGENPRRVVSKGLSEGAKSMGVKDPILIFQLLANRR